MNIVVSIKSDFTKFLERKVITTIIKSNFEKKN